jgi:hypothetical protein
MLLFNGDVLNQDAGLVGPANLTIRSGNAFADVGEPVLLVVECTLGDIHLREERWVRADCFMDVCSGDPVPDPEPDPDPIPLPDPGNDFRYYTIENDFLQVRADLRACGMIDSIVPEEGVEVVDGADNGRGLQFDMSTSEPCVECKQRWPDIPHRWTETPTQGGSYRQEANWPITFTANSTTSYTTTCKLIDYWDPNTVDSGWRLEWTAELVGPILSIHATLTNAEKKVISEESRCAICKQTPQFCPAGCIEDPRRYVEVASTWWFANKDWITEIPDLPRWVADAHFVNENPIYLNGVEYGGAEHSQEKMILSWIVDGETGEGNQSLTQPEGTVSLMSGVRWFPRRVISETEGLHYSQYLDFTDVIDPVDPDPDPEPDPGSCSRDEVLHQKINVLFEVLCEDHGMDCDKVIERLEARGLEIEDGKWIVKD